jgi:hypothetical protein
VSDEAAVTMHGIACYPMGFAFVLETVTRHEVEFDPEAEREFSPFAIGVHSEHATATFRIQYGDGRSGILGHRANVWSRARRADIMIWSGGGGGGDGHWSFNLWVQPLPPRGPVTFVCEWEPMGIPATRHEIDGELFRTAAACAKRIFPSAESD